MFEVDIRTPEIRQQKQEFILNFIKEWNKNSKKAKNLPKPHGLHKRHIKEYRDTFLAGKGCLYQLKESITRGNRVILAGRRIYDSDPSEKGKNTIKTQLPEYHAPISIHLSLLKKLERRDWTVKDVIDYEITRNMEPYEVTNFYGLVRRSRTFNEDTSIGNNFEGAYCVTSRGSNFLALCDAALEKMDSTKTTYAHLDFFAQHEPQYESSKTGSKRINSETKNNYITKMFPKIISSFDKVFVFIDDWKNPEIFTHSWCFYELYWAFRQKIETHLLFPQQLKEQFVTELNSFEVENDFHSVQDIGSTMFTFFKHFKYNQLKDEHDKEIIDEKLQEESKMLFKEISKRPIDIISESMLLLYAGSIVDMGNEYMKKHQFSEDSVLLLSKCGFFLKRAKQYQAAKSFYTNARRIAKQISFKNLAELEKRSSHLYNIHFGYTKCCCEQAIAYAEIEKHGENKTVRKAYGKLFVKEIIKARGFYIAGHGEVKLFIASKVITEFYKLLGNGKLETRWKIRLTKQEDDAITSVKEKIFSQTMMHGNRSEKEKSGLPDFDIDRIYYLLDPLLKDYEVVKTSLILKVQTFAKAMFRFNKNIVLADASRLYVSGLVNLATSSVDIQNKKIVSGRRCKKSVKDNLESFRGANTVFKDYHLKSKSIKYLEQYVYFSLDYIAAFKLLLNDVRLKDVSHFKLVNELRHDLEIMLSTKRYNSRNKDHVLNLRKALARILVHESDVMEQSKEYEKAFELLKLAQREILTLNDVNDHRMVALKNKIQLRRQALQGKVAKLTIKPMGSCQDPIPTLIPEETF